MSVKLKVCGAWRKHGHVLMSCSRGFFVTGAGFVLRALPSKSVDPFKTFMSGVTAQVRRMSVSYSGPLDVGYYFTKEALPSLGVIFTPETGPFCAFVGNAVLFDLPSAAHAKFRRVA